MKKSSETPIEHARALLKAAAPSQADLETTIGAVVAHGAAAEATIAQLAGARSDVLSNGSDTEITGHDEAARLAEVRRDQCVELASRLRTALEPVAEAHRAATIQVERAQVETKMSEARAALEAYPAAAAEIMGMIGLVAHADQAAAQFNTSHRSEPPIANAEARVRWTAATITRGEPVRGWAWAYADGRIYEPDPSAPKVLPDDRTVRTESGRQGPLAHPANAALLVQGDPRPNPGSEGPRLLQTDWWNRDFLAEIAAHRVAPLPAYVFRIHNGPRVWPVEVTRTPVETLPATCPPSLAESVRLPAMRVGEREWAGLDHDHADILAALATPLIDHRLPTRTVSIEQVVENGGLLPAHNDTAAPVVPSARKPQPAEPQELAMNSMQLLAAV